MTTLPDPSSEVPEAEITISFTVMELSVVLYHLGRGQYGDVVSVMEKLFKQTVSQMAAQQRDALLAASGLERKN